MGVGQARGAARQAGAGLLAMLVALATAGPVAAADPVFSRPTATVEFLQGITIEGTVTLSGGVERVEVVFDVEGSDRAFVSTLAVDDTSGEASLIYEFETPGGAMLPNTDLTAHFRATMDDGRLVESPAVTVHYADTRLDWQTRSGEYVTVHWTGGGAVFGQRALQIADDAVAEISGLLGVTESEPIDFFVYEDRDDFYDIIGPGSRENVGGQAHPEIRTLFANIAPDVIDDPWVGVVIPHELSHLVFDTAVDNDYHYPPRWLNEGVAVYLSEGYGVESRFAVEQAARGEALMPLSALTGQFPTTAEQFFLAYDESVSAVDFLVRRYGEDALYALIDVYVEGVTDDEAFTRAIGTDVAGFEAEWLRDLGAVPPRAYGPVEAPPGPVPPGWEGEAPLPSEVPAGSGDPAPTAGPTPAPSGDGSPTGGGGFDGTGLLVALLLVGLAMAGAGVWLQRRARAAAGVADAAAAPTVGHSPGPPVSGWSSATPMTAEPPLIHEEPMASEPPPDADPRDDP